MSDLQRLLNVAQRGAVEGTLNAENRRAFVEAADILFVRRDFFASNIHSEFTVDAAAEAISALDAVIDIADRAIASDFANLSDTWSALLPRSDAARRSLVAFQEIVTRSQNELMREQAAAVRQQRLVLQSALLAITIIGAAALIFLRREVVTRVAREDAERHVEFLAYFDQLTQLPNRTQFQKRLDQILSQDVPIALVLVDLDEFKSINDTYGHAAGDAVLCRAGTLLETYAEHWNGFAARLGGDEFAMILQTDDVDGFTASCDLMLSDARDGLVFEGETVPIGMSVGFVTTSQLGPGVPRTVDSICRVADFALYSSKTSGRGRLTRYNEILQRQYFERRALVDNLPSALVKGELDVFLQPKVTLPDQQIYGFEALIRWLRNGEMVQPEELVRVAEESGLIFELDRYVLQRACEEIGNYNSMADAQVSVSVNLSALHFTSRRIFNWVKGALEKSTLNPAMLTLEMTETAELREWEQARAIMVELRSLGAHISIDDFGTGYSSLAYLRSAIADEVKIDRTIVDQIETSDEARFLLDGVLDIAGNLGLSVVVEGVETKEQARILTDMGAQRAQGYYFGRPMPLPQALARLGRKDISQDDRSPVSSKASQTG